MKHIGVPMNVSLMEQRKIEVETEMAKLREQIAFIIGDVNNGAEVYARGNIIVLGSIKGKVFAGVGGNNEAVIAAFCLQPEILKIGDIITMSPDSEKPLYPEIARVKDNAIIVEPYLNNKYI